MCQDPAAPAQGVAIIEPDVRPSLAHHTKLVLTCSAD